MIIVGAGGHSKEVLGIMAESGQEKGVCFFDNISVHQPDVLFGQFPIIKSEPEIKRILQKDPDFILGVGKPSVRKKLAQEFRAWGGRLVSVVSPFARIGKFNVLLGDGLNIMTGAVITQDITIGEGTLVHVNATIHHDCRVGSFCELSPGCHVLGKVQIGDLSSIGSGAVILPGVTIGAGVVVGAGAVVTKNVPDGAKIKGIPAKL